MGNWFADKLNVPQQQRSTYVPKYASPQQSQRPISPDGQWEWDGREWVPVSTPYGPPIPPPPPSGLPPNAAAAKSRLPNDFCPQCHSDNGYYFSPTPGRAPKRCFECGYIDGQRDFTQSSSFDSNPTPRGSAAPGVNQVNPGTNQFGRGGV